jgi:Spy/CpxP family protein refolding chaperone
MPSYREEPCTLNAEKGPLPKPPVASPVGSGSPRNSVPALDILAICRNFYLFPPKEDSFMMNVLLTMCMALVLASPAFAQMKDMPMEHRGPGHMDMCNMCTMHGPGDGMGDMMSKCLEHADKLGLSEEQINKIKPIHREMHKKQIRFKADLEIAEIELKEIMEVKDFDLEKATAGVKKIEEIKTAQHLEMLKSMKDVRSILTDEQFKKMHKMMHMKMECNKPAKSTMKKK